MIIHCWLWGDVVKMAMDVGQKNSQRNRYAIFLMASRFLTSVHPTYTVESQLICWYEGKWRGIQNSGMIFLRTVLAVMSEHLVLWCFGGQPLNEATYFRVPPGPSTSSPFSPLPAWHLPSTVQWVHWRRWFCQPTDRQVLLKALKFVVCS